MLLFRFICAILMAWAINVALARPEARELIEAAPEFLAIGPVAAAFIGFFNLAKRQGWGMIVAVANGTWAGVLSIAAMLFIFLCAIELYGKLGGIGDYDDFTRIVGSAATPLLELFMNPGLLIVIIASSAIVGVITEIVHWCLVKLLRDKITPQS